MLSVELSSGTPESDLKKEIKLWITSIELIKNEFNNPEGEWYAVLYED